MPVKVTYTYDSTVDAWFAKTTGHLGTEEDLEQFRKEMEREIQKVQGKPFYLLADASGFSIAPSMATAYGALVKSKLTNVLGLIRYGVKDPKTSTAMLLQAIINKTDGVVMPDRESAILALEKMRSLK